MSNQTFETVQEWLLAFPQQDVRRRLERLEEKRRELTEQINALQRGLDLYEEARRLASGDTPGGTSPANGSRGAKPYPGKRVAALRLMRENPRQSYKLREIYDGLRAIGEIEDTENAYHALRVALYDALKRNEVERTGYGAYRYVMPQAHVIAPADKNETPATTGVHTS